MDARTMWWSLQSSTTLVEEVSSADASVGLRALIWVVPVLVLAAVTALIVTSVRAAGERR
jgi:hypothetical protein